MFSAAYISLGRIMWSSVGYPSKLRSLDDLLGTSGVLTEFCYVAVSGCLSGKIFCFASSILILHEFVETA